MDWTKVIHDIHHWSTRLVYPTGMLFVMVASALAAWRPLFRSACLLFALGGFLYLGSFAYVQVRLRMHPGAHWPDFDQIHFIGDILDVIGLGAFAVGFVLLVARARRLSATRPMH